MTEGANPDPKKPAGWPSGVGRQVFDTIDSTNAEAMRQVVAGATAPIWILSAEQTKGRGRRGRNWQSVKGNFAASLLIPDAGLVADAARLTFVASLAVHDALQHFIGPLARLSIKWPNDVLLNDGKISGILLESASSGPRLTALTVGIGVNLVTAPPPAEVDSWTVAPVSVRDITGDAPDPVEFLDILASGFAAWQHRLQTEGFAPIREAWLQHAARLGQIITARLPKQTLTGRFDGIDGEGSLILTTETGRVTIPAADIFF